MHGSELRYTTDFDLPADIEIRRLRIDRWRIIYAVSDTGRWAWVLRIRRRPPYGYEDLRTLVRKITESAP